VQPIEATEAEKKALKGRNTLTMGYTHPAMNNLMYNHGPITGKELPAHRVQH